MISRLSFLFWQFIQPAVKSTFYFIQTKHETVKLSFSHLNNSHGTQLAREATYDRCRNWIEHNIRQNDAVGQSATRFDQKQFHSSIAHSAEGYPIGHQRSRWDNSICRMNFVKINDNLSSFTDILMQAKSGTGKTLVFATIVLESYRKDVKAPQSLIVTPTRELAVQIEQILGLLGTESPGKFSGWINFPRWVEFTFFKSW